MHSKCLRPKKKKKFVFVIPLNFLSLLKIALLQGAVTMISPKSRNIIVPTFVSTVFPRLQVFMGGRGGGIKSCEDVSCTFGGGLPVCACAYAPLLGGIRPRMCH